MRELACCPGYINFTEKRGYAVLRVCPKGDNSIKIIKKPSGFIYDIYEKIVAKFHNN